MSWILAILLSACCLGFYDIAKKHAVNGNAVLPTVFFATLIGSSAFVGYTLLTKDMSSVLDAPFRDYLLVLIKSLIVSMSWICVYSAMAIMPISLAAPVRATAPLWTFIGALFLYHEIPSLWQGVGMLTVFCGYLVFAVWGRLEGFSWHGRGMGLILAGTLCGAVSSLYDKYLLHSLQLSPSFVQFNFSLDLVVILGLVALATRLYLGDRRKPFTWKWTIPVTGLGLILADALYFYAVSCPEIHISILSLMRRSNVLISFGFGCFIFHDKHIGPKAFGLVIIILGTVILALA